MINSLINLANYLDEVGLCNSADRVDHITKISQSKKPQRHRYVFDDELKRPGPSRRSGDRDPVLEEVRALINMADKELQEESRQAESVSSAQIYDHLINVHHIDISTMLNERREASGKAPYDRRDVLHFIVSNRSWRSGPSMSSNSSRSKLKAIKSLIKKIREAEREGPEKSIWHIARELSKELDYGEATIYGYGMAHSIDEPFGQFISLLSSRNPSVSYNTSRSKDLGSPFQLLVSEALENINGLVGSLTEDEKVAYPLLEGISSLDDLKIKSSEGGLVIPGTNFNREIRYTMQLLNASRGSQSRYQASSLERIFTSLFVTEDLGTSVVGPSLRTDGAGCGRNYVPGVESLSFKDLYENIYVPEYYIYNKLSEYLEECFGLKNTPTTMRKWMINLGLIKKRRNLLDIAKEQLGDDVYDLCKDIAPLINKIVCNELSNIPSLDMGANFIKEVAYHVYNIIRTNLKDNGVFLNCSSYYKLRKDIKSCNKNIQRRNVDINKYLDMETFQLYSLLHRELSSGLSDRSISENIVLSIQSYFNDLGRGQPMYSSPFVEEEAAYAEEEEVSSEEAAPAEEESSVEEKTIFIFDEDGELSND